MFKVIRPFLPAVVLMALFIPNAAPVLAGPQADDSQLVFALILSRHGVRPPTKDVSAYAQYSTNPWPSWDVQPGYLTKHGYQQMILMGQYYRDYFNARGLLAASDPNPALYFYTDSEERTIETGKALAEGIARLPATSVHHLPEGENDPIFHYSDHDDASAIGGRDGGNTQEFIDGYGPMFDLMSNVLGKDVRADSKSPMKALDTASTLAEIFILEYAEGMPAGWGRMTKQQIGQVDTLHALDENLKDRTFPLAQAQASNQLMRIRDTLLMHGPESGKAKGANHAYGAKQDKVVIIVGHDNQMASIGGLLGADWQLKDFAWDDTPPGGAMVFELRRKVASPPESAKDAYFVRAYYVCQTLDQMRNLTPLSATEMPSISPMYIPTASAPDGHFDCPLETFDTVAENAVDRQFTTP